MTAHKFYTQKFWSVGRQSPTPATKPFPSLLSFAARSEEPLIDAFGLFIWCYSLRNNYYYYNTMEWASKTDRHLNLGC